MEDMKKERGGDEGKLSAKVGGRVDHETNVREMVRKFWKQSLATQRLTARNYQRVGWNGGQYSGDGIGTGG